MRRSFFGGPPAGGRWGCCLTARPLAAGRGPAGVGLGTVPAPVVWSFQADRRRAWRRRRAGRGASLPAKPCSFVVKHHVFRAQGAAGVPGVVLHSPQTLVPSSSSTTSSGLKAPPAYRTWCSAPRKTLFFRRRAPRLPDPRRRRRTGRGAPLPAKPCSYVVKHHVFRTQGAAGVPGVALHSPQTLVPSSSSTTSSELKAPPAYRTWCSAPRKTLFLRRRAPRLPSSRRRRRTGRGASLPAKPCSFVVKHHVFRTQGAAGWQDVVPHSPLTLVLSSARTTSLDPNGPPATVTSKK